MTAENLPFRRDDDELVEIGVAARITGLSPSTIRRKIQNPEDDFPRPLDVGTTRRKWFRYELRQWHDAKIAAREQVDTKPTPEFLEACRRVIGAEDPDSVLTAMRDDRVASQIRELHAEIMREKWRKEEAQ